MRVILHLGAHRCATTSFQAYLERKAHDLSARGVVCVGPKRIRSGLFHGIQPAPLPFTGRDQQHRARGRIALHLRALSDVGVKSVLFSDATMMGRLEDNLLNGTLYAGVGERVARYDYAFDGAITDVVVNVRSLDTWWASAFAHSLDVSQRMPSDRLLARVARARRSWRDVLMDIYCAVPGARIWVCPHEIFATRPAAQLTAVTGQDSPATRGMFRLKPSPRLPHLRAALPARIAAQLPEGKGRWGPFSMEEAAELRETYADDMMWLTEGAEGYVTLLDNPNKNKGANAAPYTDLTRGPPHDPTEGPPEPGRLAGAR